MRVGETSHSVMTPEPGVEGESSGGVAGRKEAIRIAGGGGEASGGNDASVGF